MKRNFSRNINRVMLYQANENFMRFHKACIGVKHDSKATQFYSHFNSGFCGNRVGSGANDL